MKEITKEKIKKFGMIFSILVALFLFTTLLGYVIEIKFFGDSAYSYVEYLLYLLGYGSLDDVNVWFRLFFSIGSLLALTLFSSACTVTWLESRRVLRSDNRIVISKNEDGDFIAKLRLSSKKRDIYGAEVSLVINVNGKSFSETTELAYIPKNRSAYAEFPIELNSVIYNHFNQSYKNNPTSSDLVAAITYSDMISGTEFTVFEKFSCKNPSDFVFENDTEENTLEKEFGAFVDSTKFDVDLSRAEILDSRRPDREPYKKSGCFDICFNSDIEYNDCDFQMLFVPIPEVSEWGVYHDMRCNMSIKLSIPKDTVVEVQIKKTDGSIISCGESNRLTSDEPSLIIELSRYKRGTWENIKELCFTAFYKDVNTPDKSARVLIEDCSFELPKP